MKTNLHIAVEQGDFGQVQFLMQNKADQNLLNELNFTPLYMACVLVCFQRAKNNQQHLPPNEESIVRLQNLESIINYLSKPECNPNFWTFASISYQNQSALSWAAESKNVDLLKKVIETGVVEIEVNDNEGKTLLYWMVQYAINDTSDVATLDRTK